MLREACYNFYMMLLYVMHVWLIQLVLLDYGIIRSPVTVVQLVGWRYSFRRLQCFSGSLFVHQMESTNQQQTLLVGNSVTNELMIMEVLLV